MARTAKDLTDKKRIRMAFGLDSIGAAARPDFKMWKQNGGLATDQCIARNSLAAILKNLPCN
jgi:hypothetical protein